MLVGNAKPLLAADLRGAGHTVFLFGRVEKVGHDGIAGGAGALVVVDGEHLRHPCAAEKYGVIVTVAVCLLHNHLVLLAIDGLRHGEGVNLVGILQAGGRGEGDCSGRRRR